VSTYQLVLFESLIGIDAPEIVRFGAQDHTSGMWHVVSKITQDHTSGMSTLFHVAVVACHKCWCFPWHL
jgi:hypothetical protein